MNPSMTAPALRPLGSNGPMTYPLALGCMGMSGVYGATDDEESVATIHAALDAGVTLIDTGDFYGTGHNERLIGRALRGSRREKAQISVKFGALRTPDGAWGGFDGRPAAVKNFVCYSLDRLGVEVIDIYRPARLDPQVPIEDTVGAIADLVRQGYVRYVGLSEVSGETVRRAVAVHPICDVQIEYSLVSRTPEQSLFPVLRELGVSATLYGVLSRGLLGGKAPSGARDYRAHLPRFAPENRMQNEAIVDRLRAFAQGRGATPSQIAIAWVLARQPTFVPVIGARTREQLRNALEALASPMGAQDVAELESLIPADAIVGTRYPAAQMAHLDSER